MEMSGNAIWELAFVGALATALIDVAAWARERWFGARGPNWGVVARWVLGLGRGRLALSAADKVRPASRFEAALGWVFHYAVGIALACGLWFVAGSGWLREPALGLTVAYGAVTVALPFCLLQPAMGLGFAASKTPAPWRARINSLITHGLFGFGLFLGTVLLEVLLVP